MKSEICTKLTLENLFKCNAMYWRSSIVQTSYFVNQAAQKIIITWCTIQLVQKNPKNLMLLPTSSSSLLSIRTDSCLPPPKHTHNPCLCCPQVSSSLNNPAKYSGFLFNLRSKRWRQKTRQILQLNLEWSYHSKTLGKIYLYR